MRLHLLVLVSLVALAHRTHGFLGRPPVRDTGFLATVFTHFTRTDDLKTPEKPLSYVFIIARHGMVVPTGKSYPGDYHYKFWKWAKERFTTHGRRMMTKLGRSLATRYKNYIGGDISEVKVTTMDTEFGRENAAEILNGLFPGEIKPAIIKTNMDKYQLLKSPAECATYANLKTEALKIIYKIEGEMEYYEYLNRHIGRNKNSGDTWNMDSYQKVYNLWEITDFERKSKQWSPLWNHKNIRHKMRTFANQYLHDCTFGNKQMPIYVVGTIFKEMIEEIEKHEVKMHIHVTNDFTYAAFKSVILRCDVTAPEFGETLMVEIGTDGMTRVYSYRPYRKSNNYDMDLEFELEVKNELSFRDIKNKIQTDYGITDKLDEDNWQQLCSGKPMRSPMTPPSIPKQSLGGQPGPEIVSPITSHGYYETPTFSETPSLITSCPPRSPSFINSPPPKSAPGIIISNPIVVNERKVFRAPHGQVAGPIGS